jgi:hypothetical protein
MTASANRRRGNQHEGRVLAWLREWGLEAYHLSPSQPGGDIIVFPNSDMKPQMLELKHVRGDKPYYFSNKPDQHRFMCNCGRGVYAITWQLPGRRDPFTRFFPVTPHYLLRSVRVVDGLSWEEYIVEMLAGVKP